MKGEPRLAIISASEKDRPESWKALRCPGGCGALRLILIGSDGEPFGRRPWRVKCLDCEGAFSVPLAEGQSFRLNGSAWRDILDAYETPGKPS